MNQTTKQLTNQDRSDLNQVNWGAYYYHKGQHLIQEENEYKKRRFANFFDTSNALEKVVYSIIGACAFAAISSFLTEPFIKLTDQLFSTRTQPYDTYIWSLSSGLISAFLALSATYFIRGFHPDANDR